MRPYPLRNFEIQKYDQNEPRFTGVFLRSNLPKKIKNGAYIINLDEYTEKLLQIKQNTYLLKIN